MGGIRIMPATIINETFFLLKTLSLAKRIPDVYM